MSPNQGQVWNQMTGGIGNPLIVDDRPPAPNVNPATGPTPNGAEGRIVLAVPDADRQRRRGRHLRRLALRRRRHPRRRLRRALRHQGLRPELDRGPHPHRARDQRRPQHPGHPHQRHQPARLTPSSASAQFPPGQLRHRLAVDPTNPNIVYLGGTARRQPDRADPRRHDRHLGCPLPGRLLQRRQRRRHARPELHRAGAAIDDCIQDVPVFPRLVPELHPQPRRPVRGRRDAGRLQLRQLHQQRRRRHMDPVRHGRDRLPPRRHDDRPDDRAAAAHLRQRPGSLERPGRQRDVRDVRSGASDATARHQPQRQPPDHPVLLRCGPAQQRRRPDRRRLVLRQRPGQRRAGLATPTSSTNGNIDVERARRRRRRRGHRPAGHRARLYQYLWPCCGGNATPTSSRSTASAETFGLLQASDGLPTPDPQWPFDGRRQLRRQPGQRPGRRHQLGRRPDLRHHQRGRDLVRHRRPGGLRQPRQLQRRPGLRRTRPQRPGGRRQPGQLHLRRHRDRPDLRHPGRRRQRHEQQLDQHLHRPGRLGRRVRSSPTRPAAATTPTPSPATACSTWPTRSPRRATPPRPGSTSPAIIKNLAYTIFGQSYNPTTDPNASTLQPGDRSDLDRRRLAIHDPQSTRPTRRPGYHPVLVRRQPIRACISRSTTARRGLSSPTRPTAR